MQISLVPCADDSGASEWVLIEFQGEIESNTTDMTGLPLGQLSFKAPGVPLLVIGHHRLEGKEEKLKKPFVVLQQRLDEDDGTVTSFDVRTLVRKKLIFSKRPQPIISTLPNTAGSKSGKPL